MSTLSFEFRAFPRSLFLILILGLVLRLAFVSLHQRPLISDEKEYDSLAYSLSSHGTYAYGATPTAYRPVGYPAFVALVYTIVGHQPILVKLAQAFFDCGTALLIFILLGRYPRIRMLGALAWALFPPAILYVNLLMSETVFTFLLALTFLVLSRVEQEARTPLVISGVLVGILSLMKPSILLFAAALPLYFLRWQHIPMKNVALFATILLLAVAPWIIRNDLMFGRAALASNGGINLLIGNNPNSTGAYGITYDPAVLANARNEFEIDHLAFQAATKYILEKPINFLTGGVKKLGRLFESEGGLLVWSFHDNPEDVTSRYAAKYHSIPLFLNLATNLPYMALVLIGIFGLFSSERGPTWILSIILLVSWLMVHAIVFGGGRFHFPLMPFVIMYAVQFADNHMRTYARMTGLSKTMTFAIALALISLWIYEGAVIYSA